MSKERIFVDGIESISLIEGMVRLELFNYIPDKNHKQGERPEFEVTSEMIMSPQSFMRAFNAMQNLVGQLEKAGVVRKNDSTAAEAQPAQGVSPNFSD